MRQRMHSNVTVFAIAAVLVLISGLAATGRSIAILEFSDGNGTTSVDQWTGIAGGGWLGPWNVWIDQGGATTVSTGNPLTGAADAGHLEITRTSAASSGRQYGIERKHNHATNAEVWVSFRVRIDNSDDVSWFRIMDAVDGTTAVNCTGYSWRIEWSSTTWQAGTAAFSRTDTGVTINNGHTYWMQVKARPDEQLYDLTIKNLDASGPGTEASLTDIPMFVPANGTHVVFQSRLYTTDGSAVFDASIDSVTIGPIIGTMLAIH